MQIRHNWPVQSFWAVCLPNAEGLTQCWRSFFQLQIFWCIFFFLRAERPSVFTTLLVLTLPRYSAQGLTLPGTTICTNFSIHILSTWRMPIQWSIGAQLLDIKCQFSKKRFLVFYTNFQHSLKYILPLLQFEMLLHCKISHQAGYFLACFGIMKFWTKVQLASIFKVQPKPWKMNIFALLKNIFVTTCSMHPTTFTQPLLNHLSPVAMYT